MTRFSHIRRLARARIAVWEVAIKWAIDEVNHAPDGDDLRIISGFAAVEFVGYRFENMDWCITVRGTPVTWAWSPTMSRAVEADKIHRAARRAAIAEAHLTLTGIPSPTP